MKAVLMSIQPKWCELIANGKKTVEVRKTRPKIETPFKVYIYCTNNGGTLHSAYDGLHYHKSYIGKNDSSNINGKVIGEFVCDYILDFTLDPYGHHSYFISDDDFEDTCLTLFEELWEYGKGKTLYGWHISDLVIYDMPKELSEFIRFCPEWEKGRITAKCLKCAHYFENAAEFCAGCDCDGEIHITRAPQSYCFVEELQE